MDPYGDVLIWLKKILSTGPNYSDYSARLMTPCMDYFRLFSLVPPIATRQLFTLWDEIPYGVM